VTGAALRHDALGKHHRAAPTPATIQFHTLNVVVVRSYQRCPAYHKDGCPGMKSVFLTGASLYAANLIPLTMSCSKSPCAAAVLASACPIIAAPVDSGCCWNSFWASFVSSIASSIISLGLSLSVLAKAGAYNGSLGGLLGASWGLR